MAYVEKYYAEFIEQPSLDLGLTPALYKVSFRFPDFTGESTEIKVYHDAPVTRSKTNTDTSPFAFWQPTKCDFKLRAQNQWSVRDFYVATDRNILVHILKDPTGTGSFYSLDWAGWVIPAEFSEKYGKKPYPIAISAACGLASLKDRPMADAAGNRLQGKVPLSVAIRTALLQTGHSLDLVTVDNLFETHLLHPARLVNGKADQTKDPIYETTVDAEVFVNDKGETVSCTDALEKILRLRGLKLGQARGQWWCVRTAEVAGGWDVWTETPVQVRARTYTYETPISGSPVANASITLAVPVHIDTFPNRVLNRDPVTRISLTKPGVKLKQAFGRRRNQLPNGDWSAVDATNLPTGWERRYITAANAFRLGAGTEVDPYYMVLKGAGDEKPAFAPRISYTIVYDRTSPDLVRAFKRTLRVQFELQNVRAAKIMVEAFRTNNDVLLLKSGGGWERNYGKAILAYHTEEINGVVTTIPGRTSVELPMDALSHVTELRVSLCIGEALDQPQSGVPPLVKYYGATIESEPEGLNIIGINETVAVDKRTIEPTATLTLGDIPASIGGADFVGATYRRTTGALTTKWTKGDNAVLVNTRTQLGELIGSEARQTMQPALIFQGTILGRLEYGLFSLLQIIDINEANIPYPLILTQWEEDLRSAQHKLSAVRLLTTDPTGGLPVSKRYWQTPNAEIPTTPDTNNDPQNPALTIGLPTRFLPFNPKRFLTATPNGYGPLSGKPLITLVVTPGRVGAAPVVLAPKFQRIINFFG